MKVKIGNSYFDSKVQPIMLVLTDDNLKQLMELKKQGKYKICFHPKGKSKVAIKKFMELKNE